MDTTKLGIATAKAMEAIEQYHEQGDIAEDAYIGAVVICVALDSKTPDDAPDRDKLRDVATQCFVFSEPEELYVQLGVIEMAKGNYGPGELDDD